MTSYPMISKCLRAPSGISSTLYKVTSCSIGEANPVGALRICGSRGLPTQERREPVSCGVRGRHRGRGSGRHTEDNPIHPMDVHLGLGRQCLVRDRLPELAAMSHVAFLPRPQAVLHDRGKSNHLAHDRGTMPDLLDLVHGEEQEATEETGRGEKRRKEVQLVVRRDGESRGPERREERRREDNRDDPADAERTEPRRLDFSDDQDDADDEQEEGDGVDAEPEAHQGEQEDYDPRNLSAMTWRRDPEDDEV